MSYGAIQQPKALFLTNYTESRCKSDTAES